MNIRGKKILVTGGAGFIGSHLVDALEQENHVIILDNLSSGERKNIAHHQGKPNVEFREGDIRDKQLLHEIGKDIDVVFHLAVECLRISLKNPETNHEVNATGTLNLLTAAYNHAVERFVYVSSSEVYGSALRVPMAEDHPCNPMTVYGASKLAGELYTLAYHKTYGLQSMVVRPFNTYGPKEHLQGAYGEVIPRFVLRLLGGLPPIVFGDGTQTRDFTYVSDTVRGIVAASECDAMIGQCVNIARGREVSINELAAVIASRTGKTGLLPRYEKNRPGDVMRHYADIAKAQKLFGFDPRVDLEEGIGLYLDWFLSQNYDIGQLMKQEVVFNW
ncbi:MAG: NAD-dependent epimerase/dehydratase family protein [Nitrospirota bacterium]